MDDRIEKPQGGRVGGSLGEVLAGPRDDLVHGLLDDLGVVVLVHDMQGDLVWASPTVEQVFGVPVEQVLGTPFRIAIEGNDEARSQVDGTAASGGASTSLRLVGRHADGHHLVVDCVVRFDRDASGAVRHVVTLARDVTADVETRERFRLVAENASDVVMEMDPDNVIRWVSPSVERVLGWRPDEIVGRDLVDLVHPDDVEPTVAARERPTTGASTATELRLRTSDGGYRWIAGYSHDVHDASGALEARVVVLNAVPDVLRHERRLADLDRTRLRAVLDSELDPRVVLDCVRDEQGRVVDLVHVEANRAACDWHGVPRHRLVGMRLSDRFPRSMSEPLVAQCAAVADTGTPLVLDEVEMRQDQSDGGRRWFDVRAVRIGDGVTVSWRDVTERHRAGVAVAESEQRYRLLAENVHDVVMHVTDGVVRWISPSLTDVLGWPPESWVGRTPQTFMHPEDVAVVDAAFGPSGEPRAPMIRVRLRDPAGVMHWTQGHAGIYVGADGRPDGVIISFRLADAEVAAEAVLRERAQRDDLTGLLNRSEVIERLTGMLARSAADPSVTVAGMFCDVDDFKRVNDTLGHGAGDDVLRILGRRLQGALRRDDLVARLGGDELLVVVESIPGLSEAFNLAEKLRLRAAVPIVLTAGQVDITLSIGLTLAAPGEQVDALLARADDAMYQAKEAGKNRVVAVPPPGQEAG